MVYIKNKKRLHILILVRNFHICTNHIKFRHIYLYNIHACQTFNFINKFLLNYFNYTQTPTHIYTYTHTHTLWGAYSQSDGSGTPAETDIFIPLSSPPSYCGGKQIRSHNVHRNKVKNPPKSVDPSCHSRSKRMSGWCQSVVTPAEQPASQWTHAMRVTWHDWQTRTSLTPPTYPQTLGHPPPARHNCMTLCLSCTLIPMILPLWQTTCPLRSQNPLGEGKGCVILQSGRKT